MVLGFSKEERQEKAAGKAAKKIAERKRRAGRRRGMIEGAEKQGYEEGKEGKRAHGSILSKLEGAAKHIEIGPEEHPIRKGSGREKRSSGFGLTSSEDLARNFSMEGAGIDTKELERSLDFGGFGFGASRKKKEIRPEDLGL